MKLLNCHQKSEFRHFQLGAPIPTLLGTLWSPFWLPIGSQDGPKSLQDDPKMAPRHTKTPPSRPLEPSRTPTTAPRSSPELLRSIQEPPGTLQGSILTTPGAVWGSLWTPQGAQIRGPTRWVGGTRDADTIRRTPSGVLRRVKSRLTDHLLRTTGAKSL